MRAMIDPKRDRPEALHPVDVGLLLHVSPAVWRTADGPSHRLDVQLQPRGDLPLRHSLHRMQVADLGHCDILITSTSSWLGRLSTPAILARPGARPRARSPGAVNPLRLSSPASLGLLGGILLTNGSRPCARRP